MIFLAIYLIIGTMNAVYFINILIKDKQFDDILEEGKQKFGKVLYPIVAYSIIILTGVIIALLWPYVLIRRYVNGKGFWNNNKEV